MSSDGQTLAVTGLTGELYISTDRGASWGTDLKSVYGPDPSVLTGYGMISMSGDGKILLLSAHGKDFAWMLWVSWDGGASFQRVANCVPKGMIYRVSMSRDGTKMVVRDYHRAYQGGVPHDHYNMYYSSDYGVTWAQSQQPGNTEYPDSPQVLSGDGKKLFIGTFDGTLMKASLYNSEINW